MVICFIINNHGIKIFSSNVRGYNFRGNKFDYHKFSSKSLCNSFFPLNLKRQFARKSIEFHNLVLILIKAVCIYMSQKAFIVICIKMAQKKCQLNRVITVGEDSSSCALWKSQAGYFEHCIQDITHPSKADLPPTPLVGLPVKLEFGILFLLIHGPLYKHSSWFCNIFMILRWESWPQFYITGVVAKTWIAGPMFYEE